MKPNWKDAPEWAPYLAMDSDGSWWWHEFRPAIQANYCWGSRGKVRCIIIRISNWQDTLEERPKPEARSVCEYEPQYIKCWKVKDTFVYPAGYPTTVVSFSEQQRAEAVAKALNDLEAEQ